MKRLLIARFAVVRRDLDRVLANLTQEMFPWAPADGMRTIQGLLFEIAGKEVELLAYAKAGGQAEWVEVEDFGGRETTLDGMREVLSEIRQATLKYLDSLSEEELIAPVRFPTGWWEGLGLPELPLHEVFRSIAM